jgi:hypothetical protein
MWRLLPIVLFMLACQREQPSAEAPNDPTPPPAPQAEGEGEGEGEQRTAADESVKAGTPDEPAAAPSETATIGKPAPDFTLTDTAGKSIQLSKLTDKLVVLEWFNPECPFVRAAHTKGPLRDMAKRVAREDLIWLAINSGAPGKQGHGVERNAKAREEFELAHPILLDEEGVVGRAFGAEKTPHMAVIGPKGNVLYLGGIDNAPMGKVDAERPLPTGMEHGKHVNYVDEVLEDFMKGHPIRLPQAPSYGCSVKYAS